LIDSDGGREFVLLATMQSVTKLAMCIVRDSTTAIVPSAVHDRSHCTALAFTHSCSCDLGHTERSDNAIALCILPARHRKFLKRNMDRHHPRINRAGCASTSAHALGFGLAGSAFERERASAVRRPRVEKSMIAATMLTKFSNGRHAPQAAALSPSCPIAEFWGSGSMTAQTLTDRRAPLDRDGENDFALGRRPLSPWAPYPSPSRPAGHPRVHRADARGWLSLAQP